MLLLLLVVGKVVRVIMVCSEVKLKCVFECRIVVKISN